MTKKIKFILIPISIPVLLLIGFLIWGYFVDDTINELVLNNVSIDNVIDPSKKEGILGSHDCFSLFNVRRDGKYLGKPEIFELEYFQSFGSGAFSGKIKDYNPEMAKQFAFFINQLMQEHKIQTFRHLEADVCFYNQDLLNPEGGANLNYYIEHKYCTNSCQTGKYDIHVNLETNGTFVGYKEGKIY